MRKSCLIFTFFLLVTLSLRAQESDTDARLRKIVELRGQAEVVIPVGSFDLITLTKNVSILSVKDKLVNISLSKATIDWFVGHHLQYSIIIREETKGIVSAENVKAAMEWDSYPTYLQYDSIMQSFATLYPALCHLEIIGTSINGKNVSVLKISDNVETDEPEPEVFYTSTIHGDETGGFILMLRLADYLLKNYSTNSKVKNLVDNLEIWINPLSNPDGAYKVGGVISSSSTRGNANGIDMNRNFPDPLYPYSSSHVQQKETSDMIAFMRKHNFVISANFHSGVEVVNYPWDRWLSKLHADDTWFHSISRAYADTVHKYSSPYYMNYLDNGITRGSVWYRIYGGRQDFVTYELHGREVTIELDDSYITPAAQLSLLWLNNWHSLISYLENALYGIHGIVTNVTNSAPVTAKVFITGHDIDSSQVYSDSNDGTFYRYLNPGLWNLTFSANGYLDKTVENVLVSDWQKTVLEVEMVPVTIGIDTTDPDKPVLYPNPSSSLIRVVMPENVLGNLNVTIIGSDGKKMKDYNAEAIKGIPVSLDVSLMPAGVYYVHFENRQTHNSCWSKFIVIK